VSWLESSAWQCHLLMCLFKSAVHRWKWTVDDVADSQIFAKYKVQLSVASAVLFAAGIMSCCKAED